MMPNKEKRDSEARAKFELDVDRYVNEGLHGGTVNPAQADGLKKMSPKKNKASALSFF